MNVRQKHVAQLQLAVEDAHAEQFKAELMQTNVGVNSLLKRNKLFCAQEINISLCCAVSVVRNCCFTQESCVDHIVEELTLCKVEYEKLVLAVDNTRHQLYMSGMDITSEKGKLQFT